MIDQEQELRELKERQVLVKEIVSYPKWQFIIQFERHRDTCSVDRYLFPRKSHALPSRRRPSGTTGDITTMAPAILPVRRRRRIGSRCIDAIETGTRLEKKFLPKLKRRQRGGVDFFYCVEDYSGLNPHASAFVGNVHESRFSRDTFVRLAEESGLTIGDDEKGRYLITRWDEQWFDEHGLARYLLKSIDPTRFGNASSVLASSSSVWDYSDTFVRHLRKRGVSLPRPAAAGAGNGIAA